MAPVLPWPWCCHGWMGEMALVWVLRTVAHRAPGGQSLASFTAGRCWHENATAWFKGKKDAGIPDLASNCQSNSSSH